MMKNGTSESCNSPECDVHRDPCANPTKQDKQHAEIVKVKLVDLMREMMEKEMHPVLFQTILLDFGLDLTFHFHKDDALRMIHAHTTVQLFEMEEENEGKKK